jgi:ubiquinol-cytochrome c reductase cytochrome c1 subunit
MRKIALFALSLSLPLLAMAAEDKAAPAEAAAPVNYQEWQPGNDVSNKSSLQRGARNFANYCIGCHSMKYVRWSRVGADLKIPTALLEKNLLPAGSKAADYVQSSLRAEDAVAWFGKEPPDLSLIARSRGTERLYQFLKTFYADPSRATGANNLVLEGAAMPAVLSSLEGVKAAVFKSEEVTADGKTTTVRRFDHFEQLAPGQLSAAEFDEFLKDTVNFLDYAGEPAQVDRRSIGVWVVLFLLLFTWLALLLKKEYWKDLH